MQIQKSDSIQNLAKALAQAQAKLRNAPKTEKSHHGKYADLATVIDTARPALAEFGLSVSQLVGSNEEASMVQITTMLLHESGEYIGQTVFMKPAQNTPQSMGICITYGRRYQYSAIIGIASEEDTDGNPHGAQQQTESRDKRQDRPAQKPAQGEGKKKPDARDEVQTVAGVAGKPDMIRASIRAQIQMIIADKDFPSIKKNADARDAINRFLNSRENEYSYEVQTVDEIKPEHLQAVLEHLSNYKKWN